MATFSGAPFRAGRVNALTAGHVRKISKELLNADGYTHINFVDGVTINATLDEVAAANNGRVPNGLMGGSMMVPTGLNEVGKHSTPTVVAGNNLSVPDLNERPIGIKLEDALGGNFSGYFDSDAAPPTYYGLDAGDLLAVTVFETRTRIAAGTAGVGTHDTAGTDFVYAAGDLVFVDMISGLLTLEVPLDAANKTIDSVSAAQIAKGQGVATAAADFDPATVKNGIWPFPVGQIEDVDFEGQTSIVVRLHD